MIDKKMLRIYLIALVVSFIPIVFAIINGFVDNHANDNFYKLPFGNTNYVHQLFFYLFAYLIPYLAIFLGYALAYLAVRLFCKFSKFSKRIQFVGYAQTERTGKYLKRRYLIQILFAVLLCINIWVIIVDNDFLMQFWLTQAGLDHMLGPQGQYFNFVFVPWYWTPIFLTALVFALCSVIMDSGLVSVKKLSGQSEFSDTERVGDKLFSIVKGYAGISVVLSFIILIQSPKGNETSLVLFPIFALCFVLHVIVAIDLFRNIGKKWVFKASKRYYEPQMIKLSFDKTEISNFKDLLN